MLHGASDSGASGHPRLEAQSESVPLQIFLDRVVHQVQGHWRRAPPSAASSLTFGHAVSFELADPHQAQVVRAEDLRA